MIEDACQCPNNVIHRVLPLPINLVHSCAYWYGGLSPGTERGTELGQNNLRYCPDQHQETGRTGETCPPDLLLVTAVPAVERASKMTEQAWENQFSLSISSTVNDIIIVGYRKDNLLPNTKLIKVHLTSY